MTRKFLSLAAASFVVLLFTTTPFIAHHSEAAQFDTTKPVKVSGVVKKVEKGNVTTWGFSGLPPGMAIRKGFTKDTLKVGETVVVQGFRAKDGSNNASGNILTFADGRQVFPGALELGTFPANKP